MSIALQKYLLTHRGRGAVYSVCSAHSWVLQAAAAQAKEDGSLLVIEATSNQVNQDGGYTGMLPADFHAFAMAIARNAGLREDQVILGGDHLGPNPWSSLPAAEAMQRAVRMVEMYVAAGFTKIHLDASMRCADDPEHIPDETVAQRAAQLCAAAETAARTRGTQPVYIIGTEVPPPGGASHALDHVEVTNPSAVERTWQVHRDAFADMPEAWKRVLAIVVQPGVEFDHASVIDYKPEEAKKLQKFLQAHPELVFEAHSTDYQKPAAYRALVQDGFAILKVGPALTFALREALYALAAIEDELLPAQKCSRLRDVLEETMLTEPGYWQKYYHGSPEEQRALRSFSYSDRIRYYWPNLAVQKAVDKLMTNLAAIPIPETLLSLYLPSTYERVREGEELSPKKIVREHIRSVLRVYSNACADPARTNAA